jgi:hypothetical protein
VLYAEGETETLIPTFWADLADGSRSHQYRLVGDETVLTALATEQQHHYVQITGTIVLAENTTWGEQALEVTAFAQPWPEQQVKAHVGLFSQELYDGTMWTLFTDAADGQAYVLPENGPRFEALLGAEQVWLAGVVHPAYLVNGRPLLRALEALPAQPGETLTVTSHAMNNEPQRWQASAAPNSLEKGDFVIETVELAYFYAPLEKQDVAEPVWVVSGHRRETQTLFVAYLDAVAR